MSTAYLLQPPEAAARRRGVPHDGMMTIADIEAASTAAVEAGATATVVAGLELMAGEAMEIRVMMESVFVEERARVVEFVGETSTVTTGLPLPLLGHSRVNAFCSVG